MPGRLRGLLTGSAGALAVLAARAAFGEEVAEVIEVAPTINAGDTAWVLTSSALVLMMTVPGLLNGGNHTTNVSQLAKPLLSRIRT